MRPTAFIIVVYILFLLTQPCQDVLGAPPAAGDEVSASETTKDEDCNENEDGCSPFCICSCRHTPAGYFYIGSAPDRQILITPTWSTEIEYRCRLSTAYTDSVWQPPKH